jgi:hypothetical protein
MFRSLKADAAPKINAFVDWRVVVRAYGNHRQRRRLSLSIEMNQGRVRSGAYILRSSPYPAM